MICGPAVAAPIIADEEEDEEAGGGGGDDAPFAGGSDAAEADMAGPGLDLVLNGLAE